MACVLGWSLELQEVPTHLGNQQIATRWTGYCNTTSNGLPLHGSTTIGVCLCVWPLPSWIAWMEYFLKILHLTNVKWMWWTKKKIHVVHWRVAAPGPADICNWGRIGGVHDVHVGEWVVSLVEKTATKTAPIRAMKSTSQNCKWQSFVGVARECSKIVWLSVASSFSQIYLFIYYKTSRAYKAVFMQYYASYLLFVMVFGLYPLLFFLWCFGPVWAFIRSTHIVIASHWNIYLPVVHQK